MVAGSRNILNRTPCCCVKFCTYDASGFFFFLELFSEWGDLLNRRGLLRRHLSSHVLSEGGGLYEGGRALFKGDRGNQVKAYMEYREGPMNGVVSLKYDKD